MIVPRKLVKGAVSTVAALSIASGAHAQGLVVFDPANYQQNLLSAVRALEGVQNQIRQLQNEAAALARMDRHLLTLQGSVAPDLQGTLASLRARVAEGDALALNVQQTNAAYARLYPTAFSDTLSSDEHVRAARTRWDEAYASFKRSAVIQGQITESAEADARLLDQALSLSAGAAGSLQVAQAGNELTALQVKQSLQLQTLLAAQARAETAERARTLVAEEQARTQFKTFLGDGRAYTRGQ